LENPEEKKYAVIITEPADIAFYEVLDYLYENYPIERAEEIAEGLRDTVRTLESKPERGALESRLLHRQRKYRFILYKRTPRAEIKIIYFTDDKSRTVYVTDFFPTEKDDMEISGRNF
jgi:plasmid stabilization system protein ParE